MSTLTGLRRLRAFSQVCSGIPPGDSARLPAEISYAGSLNPLLIFLNTAGNAVKNIEDAPLRFNTLVMHHTFGTANSLMWDILHFYMRQGIMEFYKVCGV